MMIRRYLSAAIFAVILTSCGKDKGPGPTEGFNIAVDPTQNQVGVGSTVILKVRIDNVENLFAISFDLLYDTTLARVESVYSDPQGIFGNQATLRFFGPIDGGVGIGVGRAQSQWDDNLSGSGALVNITFRGLAAGTTGLNIVNVSLVDQDGLPNPNLSRLTVTPGILEIQ